MFSPAVPKAAACHDNWPRFLCAGYPTNTDIALKRIQCTCTDPHPVRENYLLISSFSNWTHFWGNGHSANFTPTLQRQCEELWCEQWMFHYSRRICCQFDVFTQYTRFICCCYIWDGRMV